MSLATALDIKLSAQLRSAADVDAGHAPVDDLLYEKLLRLTNGTGANQAASS